MTPIESVVMPSWVTLAVLVLLLVFALSALRRLCGGQGSSMGRVLAVVGLVFIAFMVFGMRSSWRRPVHIEFSTKRTILAQGRDRPSNVRAERDESRARSTKVEGPYEPSFEDAYQGALQLAHERVRDQLVSMDYPLVWDPPVAFVRDRLVKSYEDESKKFDQIPGSPIMHHVVMTVEINDEDWAEILRRNHRFVVEHRMLWLGKVLAVLVAFLAAVAGYVRLDEQTKGYYRSWLKAGAMGFVLAVGVGLFLLVID